MDQVGLIREEALHRSELELLVVKELMLDLPHLPRLDLPLECMHAHAPSWRWGDLLMRVQGWHLAILGLHLVSAITREGRYQWPGLQDPSTQHRMTVDIFPLHPAEAPFQGALGWGKHPVKDVPAFQRKQDAFPVCKLQKHASLHSFHRWED